MAQEPRIIYKTITINKDNWQSIINDKAIQASLGSFDIITEVVEIYNYEVQYEDFDPKLRFFIHNACCYLNGLDKEKTKRHEIQHWKKHQVIKRVSSKLNQYEQMLLQPLDEISARYAAYGDTTNHIENITKIMNNALYQFNMSYDKYIDKYTGRCELDTIEKIKKNRLEVLNLLKQKPIYSDDFHFVVKQMFTMNGCCVLNNINADTLQKLMDIKRRSEQATEKLIKKILDSLLTY